MRRILLAMVLLWSGTAAAQTAYVRVVPVGPTGQLSPIDQIVPFPASASTALNVNGDFSWDQKNEGASVVSPVSLTTVIDGWNMDGPTNVAMNFQRQTMTVGSNPVVPPPGYATYLRMSSSGSHTFVTGEHAQMKTQLTSTSVGFLKEGTSQAAPLAMDYCLQANSAFTYPIKLPLFIDNNNQGGTGFANSRIYVHDVTLTAAGQWFCGTVTVPGDTIGGALWQSPTAKSPIASSSNMAMVAGIGFGSGPDYQTATPDTWVTGYYLASTASTNIASVSGGFVYFTGFHIRPATTPQVPYVPLPQDQEYARVRRYYWKTFINSVAPAQNVGLNKGEVCTGNPIANGQASIPIMPPLPMVDQPALTLYNPAGTNANARDVTAGADVVATPYTGNSGVTGVNVNMASVAAAGDNICIQAALDATVGK